MQDQRKIFDPVFSVLNRATAVTMVLAAVMIVVAIMLTGTTIRMSAASRKNETEIMRLVGASNWTIRLPPVRARRIRLIPRIVACGRCVERHREGHYRRLAVADRAVDAVD